MKCFVWLIRSIRQIESQYKRRQPTHEYLAHINSKAFRMARGFRDAVAAFECDACACICPNFCASSKRDMHSIRLAACFLLQRWKIADEYEGEGRASQSLFLLL
jgi:hypothetical protein